MNDALIVMNPRNIPETMDALAHLPIPKIYLRGWSENRIAQKGWEYAMTYGYDWYWVCSDDIIVRPYALEALREAWKWTSSPVITGYSQRSHTDWTVNLCEEPLEGDVPVPEAYKFMDFHKVVSGAARFRTYFTGMSLTGMHADTWAQFPFACYADKTEDPGYASDFHLSLRLQRADIPICAVRDAFCYHWRHKWENTNDVRDAAPDVGDERIVVST